MLSFKQHNVYEMTTFSKLKLLIIRHIKFSLFYLIYVPVTYRYF